MTYPPTPHSQGQFFKLTSLRRLAGATRKLSGRELAALWESRFHDPKGAYPYWLYIHIPFCPRICSFCYCATGRIKRDNQVDEYLGWMEEEIRFFGHAARNGRARLEYIGGGTPNVLTVPQLERLFRMISSSFTLEEGARRTFEFLPSSLTPGQLEVVAEYGYNRLSCGVQTTDDTTLHQIRRSAQSMRDLGDIVEQAYSLGIDDINFDLVWGLPGEDHKTFVTSLRQALQIRPTTVTIHRLVYPPNSPIKLSPAQEVEREREFRALGKRLEPLIKTIGPGYSFFYRPNVLVIEETNFHKDEKRFAMAWYSDGERTYLDVLGLGQYAGSHIMGKSVYDNLGQPGESWSPDDKIYSAYRMEPEFDAALDIITDLMEDGRTAPERVYRRYAGANFDRIKAALKVLEKKGTIVRAGDSWEYPQRNYVFVDPLYPLLSILLENQGEKRASQIKSPRRRPTNFNMAVVGVPKGPWTVEVCVEVNRNGEPPYAQLGRFSISYLDSSEVSQMPAAQLDELMQEVVAQAKVFIAENPKTSVSALAARVEKFFKAKSGEEEAPQQRSVL